MDKVKTLLKAVYNIDELLIKIEQEKDYITLKRAFLCLLSHQAAMYQKNSKLENTIINLIIETAGDRLKEYENTIFNK